MTIFWRTGFWKLLLLPLALLPITAWAEPNQSLKAIVVAASGASEQQAKSHGYEHVSVVVKPLDNRLKLNACSEPLETFLPQGSQVIGSVSVGVRCADTKPWTIYVRTKVTAMQSVPVLARSVARNSVITEADLKFVTQPLNALSNGVVLDKQQLLGMELTRTLDAGSRIKLSQLRAPKVIKRGQQVTMIAAVGGLEVKILGTALSDASAGERVSVSNLDSGKRIEGIAHSDGTVAVQ